MAEKRLTQGDLTVCCGISDNDSLDDTISSLMEKTIQDVPIGKGEAIIHHEEGIDLIPANIELSNMDLQLVSTMNRERIMSMYLQGIKKDYEYILIDCMPSLGMITVNAFASADSVIIPVQPRNALHPISVTESGIVMLVRPVQPLNALHSIFVTESGIAMLVRPVQS